MAVLKIYNEITTEEDKQFLKWCMGMDGVCFKDIDEFLSGMDEKDNTVDIRLHCDGGSVSEGWAIYACIRERDFSYSRGKGCINGYYHNDGSTQRAEKGI